MKDWVKNLKNKCILTRREILLLGVTIGFLLASFVSYGIYEWRMHESKVNGNVVYQNHSYSFKEIILQ